MESRDHKAIQDVFAKPNAKKIDVHVKKIMFYVIQISKCHGPTNYENK